MCQGLSYLQTIVIVSNSGLLTGKVDPPQFYSSVSFIWQAFCKSRVLNHLPLRGMKTVVCAVSFPSLTNVLNHLPLTGMKTKRLAPFQGLT